MGNAVLVLTMLVLGVVATHSHAAGDDDLAPLDVRLNGESRGTHLIRIVGEQPCLSVAQLREFGAPETALPARRGREVEVVALGEARECVDASTVAPRVGFSLDIAAARLDIRVDPTLLQQQTVSAADVIDHLPAQYTRSAYLNYGLDLARESGARDLQILAPLELVARRDRWLAQTTLIANESGARRLLTSVQRDLPERLAALRFGDVVPSVGSSAGTSLMGLQFAREFAYEPFTHRSPGLDFAGVLDTPSTVEVYVDGRMVSRRDLPAGPFDIQELPVSAGTGGTVRVEIVDAFGNRRVVEQPYFLGGGLLAAGQSEFSYEAGLPRAFGAGDRYLHEPAVLFAHRWGLHDDLTLGYEGFASQTVHGAGGRADVGLGHVGEIGVSVLASSTADAHAGHLGSVGYRYNDRRATLVLDYSERSSGFRTLTATRASAQRRWRAGMSRRLGARWSASLGYTRSQGRAPGARGANGSGSRFSAGLNAYLGGANLGVQAQWDPQVSEAGLLVTMSTATRSGAVAQLSFADAGGSREADARYDTPLRGYVDDAFRFDYRQVENETGAAQTFDGEVEHRATHYTARALHQHAQDLDRSRLSLAGSLAASDEGLAFGQPIRGSFVAVDVPDVDGAEVYADGRLIGRSGRGTVMVSDLAPYLPHSMRLQLPGDLPIGIDLPTDAQRLALADRGGHWLRFTPRRLRLYEGRVVREDGRPVEFTPVRALQGSGVIAETVTGENGYLYLEHLEAGSYEFEVGGGRPCRFRAELPQSDETLIALGEQRCDELHL